jgi:hypothetical protein
LWNRTAAANDIDAQANDAFERRGPMRVSCTASRPGRHGVVVDFSASDFSAVAGTTYRAPMIDGGRQKRLHAQHLVPRGRTFARG